MCQIEWLCSKIKKLFNKNNLPVMLLLLVTVIIGFIGWKYFSRPLVGSPSNILDTCTLKKMSFDIIIEMNKLLLSIELLIITGVGIFVMNRDSNPKIESCWYQLLWMSAYLAGVLSIFFGYILYDRLAEMTYNGMFNIRHYSIVWLRTLQFYLLLCSVILFFFSFLTQREGSCNTTYRKVKDKKN